MDEWSNNIGHVNVAPGKALIYNSSNGTLLEVSTAVQAALAAAACYDEAAEIMREHRFPQRTAERLLHVSRSGPENSKLSVKVMIAADRLVQENRRDDLIDELVAYLENQSCSRINVRFTGADLTSAFFDMFDTFMDKASSLSFLGAFAELDESCSITERDSRECKQRNIGTGLYIHSETFRGNVHALLRYNNRYAVLAADDHPSLSRIAGASPLSEPPPLFFNGRSRNNNFQKLSAYLDFDQSEVAFIRGFWEIPINRFRELLRGASQQTTVTLTLDSQSLNLRTTSEGINGTEMQINPVCHEACSGCPLSRCCEIGSFNNLGTFNCETVRLFFNHWLINIYSKVKAGRGL